MNRTQLTQWFRNQQPTIEQIILEAAQAFVAANERNPNFGYDLSIAQQEAYNLVQNTDLCYDRYTTPLAYSLWYQARRMNVFLSHFCDKVTEACAASQPVEVFDLGAGTGCVQFCFGLAAVAFKRAGKRMPLMRIINVDVSPFMLSYLRSYLWPAAIKHYPELRDLLVEYHVYSWTNRGEFSITNPWVCASYLFDSSENESYLQSNFDELIKSFEPSKILMLTSAQERKRNMMSSLSAKMRQRGFNMIVASSDESVFQGALPVVSAYRMRLVEKYRLKASKSAVSWADGSFNALGLEKQQSGLSFNMRSLPEVLDLFNPPLRVRREVQLNDDQIRAARYEEQPSIITGPAGCGKSIVVTEKIINVLEKHKWTGPLNILVTTFNKSLIKQLRAWLTDLLEAKGKSVRQQYNKVVNGVNDGTGDLTTGAEFSIQIRFVHFEMLGKYVGSIQFKPFNENTHRQALERFVLETKKEQGIAADKWNEILNPDFLLEEYHRVIYGLQCKLVLGEDNYQGVERKGRGRRISLNRGPRRKAVFTALHKYGKWMHADPQAGQSYLARRQMLFNELESRRLPAPFDYVFVDEFQDCTPTDYKLMGMMLKNVDRLVLAGDLAQAVHIGQSGSIPRDKAMARRVYYRLNGSYRLPFRICEAIYPLSEAIAASSLDREVTAEITPYKGAPPGARPIIVGGANDTELAQKIIAIRAAYLPFDINQVTIMEKDDGLCREIRRAGIPVETTTILRLKGLEKELVVWSLQAEVEYEDEVKEFVYTIATRTNCMLVVAISQNAKAYFKPLLGLLRPDRLICWDAQSENLFTTYKQVVSSPLIHEG
ncbi:UvrD/REP helicase N-terminal domain-containing protein [Cnuella takakiae]|uniref:UvrD/REP helicase N-terminal domain-containing protein n=1 Tax=Cnuella takakiae TaxID=1302690 RepID=A0A1M4TBY1_9BACT|nr:UvrD-helicase domain-containing protein [Cnuella takakiae]OLY90708.1 hypothetical protein BUE76_01450 [Cnuella takakiae]SHE42049.1 UvrD/REP helicase N-terminal domain-containing protein [Cnuella takakiae]